MMYMMNLKRWFSLSSSNRKPGLRLTSRIWKVHRDFWVRKRRTVVENLSFKLAVEVTIEIEAMFKRIRTATVEIVRDTRDV